MKYKMNIAGLDRELPLCKVSDDLYIGAFIMFGDAEITVACARELLARAPKDYDYLLTAEAKSIPLIHEMARQSGAREYFVARKGLKVYMPHPLHVTVRSITTQHDQDLYLSGEEADKIRGKRVLIVDDVISTGESLRAMEELVETGRRHRRRPHGRPGRGRRPESQRHRLPRQTPRLQPRRHRQSLIHNNIVPPRAALQQPRFFASPKGGSPFRGRFPLSGGNVPKGQKG